MYYRWICKGKNEEKLKKRKGEIGGAKGNYKGLPRGKGKGVGGVGKCTEGRRGMRREGRGKR